jgi:hypothetical protein
VEDNGYWTYDSRAPLERAAPPLARSRYIGVLASKPFHHHGMNAPYVDIQLETVSLRTETYGNCYPAETFHEEIRRATTRTIADLDAAIAELTAHRDRLSATLGTACPAP